MMIGRPLLAGSLDVQKWSSDLRDPDFLAVMGALIDPSCRHLVLSGYAYFYIAAVGQINNMWL